MVNINYCFYLVKVNLVKYLKQTNIHIITKLAYNENINYLDVKEFSISCNSRSVSNQSALFLYI